MSKKLSLRPDFMFFFMLEATGFITCKSFCQFCATITKKNTQKWFLWQRGESILKQLEVKTARLANTHECTNSQSHSVIFYAFKSRYFKCHNAGFFFCHLLLRKYYISYISVASACHKCAVHALCNTQHKKTEALVNSNCTKAFLKIHI